MRRYKFYNKLICIDGVEGMKMLPDEVDRDGRHQPAVGQNPYLRRSSIPV